MNLHPLLILFAVIATGYIVLRWGSVIFLCYALFHLCAEQWTAATLAFVFAFFIEFVKRMVIGLSRLTGAHRKHWT
jgi:hypothetical protein